MITEEMIADGRVRLEWRLPDGTRESRALKDVSLDIAEGRMELPRNHVLTVYDALPPHFAHGMTRREYADRLAAEARRNGGLN